MVVVVVVVDDAVDVGGVLESKDDGDDGVEDGEGVMDGEGGDEV